MYCAFYILSEGLDFSILLEIVWSINCIKTVCLITYHITTAKWDCRNDYFLCINIPWWIYFVYKFPYNKSVMSGQWYCDNMIRTLCLPYTVIRRICLERLWAQKRYTTEKPSILVCVCILPALFKMRFIKISELTFL